MAEILAPTSFLVHLGHIQRSYWLCL